MAISNEVEKHVATLDTHLIYDTASYDEFINYVCTRLTPQRKERGEGTAKCPCGCGATCWWARAGMQPELRVRVSVGVRTS